MMKKMSIAKGEIIASEISLGCYRMRDVTVKNAAAIIETALDEGIDFFDHADKYGDGKSEEIFAQAIDMKPSIREKIMLQSKCGLKDGSFDFSKEHILKAVDGSLKRLQTEYLDVLLLHRPDALVEPEEVAEAFTILHRSGKVRYFGVSNHNPMQIELLNKYLNQKLIINQLQFSPTNTGMLDAGLNVNMQNANSINRDGSILDYCRLKDIQVQAWSPFLFGQLEGVYLDNDKFPELNQKIDEIAKIKGVPKVAIVVAWISRHPAKIQTIVGTMNPSRLKDICKASSITITREEWYEIYLSAGNLLP
jgi:predicted oxidoreductase